MTPLGPTATGFTFLFGLPAVVAVVYLVVTGHYWGAFIVAVISVAVIWPFARGAVDEFCRARQFERESQIH